MSEKSVPKRPRKAKRQTIAGYARGEETRQRIIAVALELFSRHGYEHVSMRNIAEQAGVNATVLHYYFAGKHGLYFSCAEHIHTRERELMQDVLVQTREKMARNVSRDELVELICMLFERSIEYLLRTPELQVWSEFMRWDRDKKVPAAARKLPDQGIRQEFRQLIWDLIGRITGKDSNDLDTRIRALTLGGQLLPLDLASKGFLDRLGLSVVDEQGLKRLQAIVREQTTAALKVHAPA
jgi:AcrR family transcriptional regulator